MNIAISSDSTCDLSKEIIDKYNISIAPLHVTLGDKDFKDGEDISPSDIFSFVKKENTLPKTSACSIYEYKELFEKLLEKYDHIIHFTISKKCSSTYNNAILAASEFEGRVDVLDTTHLSIGQGLLVLKACDLIDSGKDVGEVLDIINNLKDKVQTSFVIDTLDYLYKGGRCNGLARIATKLFSIHPSIKMSDGVLEVGKKYLGKLKKSVESYAYDLAKEYTMYDDTRFFITHSCCEQSIVNAAFEIVKECFKFKEIIETKAGSVVTSHCGQGTLGILFIKK